MYKNFLFLSHLINTCLIDIVYSFEIEKTFKLEKNSIQEKMQKNSSFCWKCLNHGIEYVKTIQFVFFDPNIDFDKQSRKESKYKMMMDFEVIKWKEYNDAVLILLYKFYVHCILNKALVDFRLMCMCSKWTKS